jgi:hypothetical protein
MTDLKRYYRLYPKGLCWVEKYNEDKFVVYFKRFDNETGAELPPEPNYVTIEEMEHKRDELTQELEAVNSILADIT